MLCKGCKNKKLSGKSADELLFNSADLLLLNKTVETMLHRF